MVSDYELSQKIQEQIKNIKTKSKEALLILKTYSSY